eukprot:2437259-Pleurochrysis_carterae.AAC.1
MAARHVSTAISTQLRVDGHIPCRLFWAALDGHTCCRHSSQLSFNAEMRDVFKERENAAAMLVYNRLRLKHN